MGRAFTPASLLQLPWFDFRPLATYAIPGTGYVRRKRLESSEGLKTADANQASHLQARTLMSREVE